MTTAFVLSGGGSHGAVHIGMALALREQNIWPDMLIGSSVGALNAVALAKEWGDSNLALCVELWTAAAQTRPLDITPSTVLWRALTLKPSLLDPKRLDELISRNVGQLQFEDLQIPTLVAATDLKTGQEVVFDRGEVRRPLLASCAVPGVFPPVDIDGSNYVDGLIHGAPVRQALSRGFDRVLVLACNPPTPTEGSNTWYGIARSSATTIMNRHLMDVAVPESIKCTVDFLPRSPELDGLSRRDFRRSKHLIESAYEQALRWLRDRDRTGRVGTQE